MRFVKTAVMILIGGMCLSACGSLEKETGSKGLQEAEPIIEEVTRPADPVPSNPKCLLRDNQKIYFGECTVRDLVEFFEADGWILAQGDLKKYKEYFAVEMKDPYGRGTITIHGAQPYTNAIIPSTVGGTHATDLTWNDGPDLDSPYPSFSQIVMVGGLTFNTDHTLEDCVQSLEKNMEGGSIQQEQNEYTSFLRIHDGQDLTISCRFNAEGTKLDQIELIYNYEEEEIDYDELFEIIN